MNSILDHGSPATDQIFTTGIALSTKRPTSHIEPLPFLDYFLINQLITLTRPYLNKRQLKCLEYVVDARTSFYNGHHKVQVAYRELVDAYACAEAFDRRSEDLGRQLADTLANEDGVEAAKIRRQLSSIEIQRQSNNQDMRIRLDTLRAQAKTRQTCAVWYSDLKVVFLKHVMPDLIALGKQSYDWAMGQRRKLPTPPPHSTSSSRLPPPSQHLNND